MNQERAFQKYSCIILVFVEFYTLLVASVFLGILFFDLIPTAPFEVSIFEEILTLILLVLATAIILKPFRHRRRWAWYVLWTLPIFWGYVLLTTLRESFQDISILASPQDWTALILQAILVCLSLLGLLLPFRSFFPKRPEYHVS